MMSVQAQEVHICMNCEDRTEMALQPYTTMTVPMDKLHFPTFEDYMDSVGQGTAEKDWCDCCYTTKNFHVRTRIAVPEACKFIFIEMGLFAQDEDGQMTRQQRTVGKPPARIDLYG